MKKCPDCSREIDKYAIACQYCGKLPNKEYKENAKEAGHSTKKAKPKIDKG